MLLGIAATARMRTLQSTTKKVSGRTCICGLGGFERYLGKNGVEGLDDHRINWVPDPSHSRSRAVLLGSAFRYDRADVIAPYASATAMIRAINGMSSPLSPSGYPAPSIRSW